MKKLNLLITAVLIVAFSGNAFSQMLSESAKRKVTVGADVYTDIWMNVPSGVDTRTINQGANVFLMYNLQLAESNSTFAFGLGFSNHNMYGDFTIPDVKADSIVIEPIPSSVSYKKSKMAYTSIDLPLELKLKLDNGVKFGIGFKIGWVISSKTKYKGDIAGVEHKTKDLGIDQLENFVYGATARVGYKVINLFCNYQISKVFQTGKGPDKLYPISVGVTITPF
ncbi:MAG TPA: outer membrane beta-barrel protein [Bacteroidales bacterium]